MKKWTVIFMWNDNGQIGASHVEASSAYFAFEEVVKDPPEFPEDIKLLAAVPGWLEVAAPLDATTGGGCDLVDYPGYQDEDEDDPQEDRCEQCGFKRDYNGFTGWCYMFDTRQEDCRKWFQMWDRRDTL